MHGDRAALGLYNMPREGETQPGPLPGLPAVGKLGKLLEQPGHLVGADADSGVFHLQPQRLIAVGAMRNITLPPWGVNFTALER